MSGQKEQVLGGSRKHQHHDNRKAGESERPEKMCHGSLGRTGN